MADLRIGSVYDIDVYDSVARDTVTSHVRVTYEGVGVVPSGAGSDTELHIFDTVHTVPHRFLLVRPDLVAGYTEIPTD